MTENPKNPLILGFVSDLMFTVRIEDVANRLDYRVRWVARLEEIAQPSLEPPPAQLGEHLVGPGAALIDKITLWKPALILFDLSNSGIPWREWVALIKSAPAARRLPVVCFGSHMDVEAMQAARNAGSDAVLARSRFVSDIPGLIRKYARLPEVIALEESCDGPLSELAVEGLALFNRGQYFVAHEYLEDAWNEDQTAGRELYRAILQVAVAYLHIERGNYNGALKMFLRVRQWIDPLPGRCRGVNIARLRTDAYAVHASLVDLGPERLDEFDRGMLQPVEFS